MSDIEQAAENQRREETLNTALDMIGHLILDLVAIKRFLETGRAESAEDWAKVALKDYSERVPGVYKAALVRSVTILREELEKRGQKK